MLQIVADEYGVELLAGEVIAYGEPVSLDEPDILGDVCRRVS
jgi:hypothetical protein